MRWFAAWLCLLVPIPALAAPIVADISNYRIDIDAGFNGTRLFLFGARNDNGDVVVVIRGPRKDYIVRKKEEIAGLWINRDRVKFYDVPDFYAIASNHPLKEELQSTLFRRLGLGEENLLAEAPSQAGSAQFADAYLRFQRNRGLYENKPGTVSFMGETLFKTTVIFPGNIPPGNYTAEIYLLSGGDIMGMQSIPITVVKSGLDAFLYGYAHHSPVFYGLTAVVLALAGGWMAGRIFERI